MPSKNLERLEELTAQLDPPVTLPYLIKDSRSTAVEYQVPGGESFGFALYNDGHVAIQRAYVGKGACFTSHVHPGSREWLICYEGSIKVSIEGLPVKKLAPGDGVYINADTAHECEALEDSWLIGITIPAEEHYPDA